MLKKSKSEKLTKEVKASLKKWVANQPTKAAAAQNIGLSRSNLDRVMVLGSCRPATADRIRQTVLNHL